MFEEGDSDILDSSSDSDSDSDMEFRELRTKNENYLG